LRAEVRGELTTQLLVQGARNEDVKSRAQFHYAIDTRAAASGIEVAISDAKLDSYQGPPRLQGEIDRDMRIFAVGLRFFVERDGKFARAVDGPATIQRVKDALKDSTMTPRLKQLVIDGFDETGLKNLLAGLWEGWSSGAQALDVGEAKQVPLETTVVDGTTVKLKMRYRLEGARCPDGSRGCKRLTVRGVPDGDGMRAHTEEVIRKVEPAARLAGWDNTLASETLLAKDGRPLSLKRTQHREITVIRGETEDRTVQIDESRLAFEWR
jgi:hypothetical protein